jgi:hypothetical protein
MKISIDIENRLVTNGGVEKEVVCYVPRINGHPVMGTSYILKESVNNEREKTDNLELARFFLQRKIDEINKFINSNNIFLGGDLKL